MAILKNVGVPFVEQPSQWYYLIGADIQGTSVKLTGYLEVSVMLLLSCDAMNRVGCYYVDSMSPNNLISQEPS